MMISTKNREVKHSLVCSIYSTTKQWRNRRNIPVDFLPPTEKYINKNNKNFN